MRLADGVVRSGGRSRRGDGVELGRSGPASRADGWEVGECVGGDFLWAGK